MCGLFGYIFNNLDNHEKALKLVYNNLKAQKTFNKYVVCFMFVGCAYVHANNKTIAKLEKNNRRLAKQLESLVEEREEESLEQVKDILKKALGEE